MEKSFCNLDLAALIVAHAMLSTATCSSKVEATENHVKHVLWNSNRSPTFGIRRICHMNCPVRSSTIGSGNPLALSSSTKTRSMGLVLKTEVTIITLQWNLLRLGEYPVMSL